MVLPEVLAAVCAMGVIINCIVSSFAAAAPQQQQQQRHHYYFLYYIIIIFYYYPQHFSILFYCRLLSAFITLNNTTAMVYGCYTRSFFYDQISSHLSQQLLPVLCTADG